jgi:hypothetical protein
MTAGLAVFVVIGEPREGHNRPPVPAWALVAAVFVPVVVACVGIAGLADGDVRCCWPWRWRCCSPPWRC